MAEVMSFKTVSALAAFTLLTACAGESETTDDNTEITTPTPTVTPTPSSPSNILPVANFNTFSDGLSITVVGNISTDSDGEIVSYEWNFNNEATASGSSANYTFTSTGSKTITLTVTDDQNGTHQASQIIIFESEATTPTPTTPTPTPTITPTPITPTPITPTPVNPTPTPTPTPTPEVSLLSFAIDNIIGGDINCAACHLTGGTASGTNFVVADLTENSLEGAIRYYIELDTSTNVQLLKDKPGGTVFHIGGNEFDGYPYEQSQWEALVDEIAATIIEPVASNPEASFTTSISNLTITADATSSTEGSNNNHSYAWSLSNGDTANGITTNFTVDDAGDYVVTLTLTDDVTGYYDTTSEAVTVTDNTELSSNCDIEGVATCFDFEDGLPNELSGQNNASRSIDTNTGYQSTSSVKVTTSDYSDGGFFNIAPPADSFWARVFVKGSGDNGTYANNWGGNTQGFARSHGTLIRGRDDNAQLRIGDHRCQLELNRDGGNGHLGDDLEMTSGEYGDNTTICQQDVGARMEPEKWYCLEVHFNGTESEIQVFWDNQNVQQLHVTEERTWTNADKAPGGAYSANADQPWGPYYFDSFEFGYENYEGSGPTQENGQKVKPTNTYWYDGVATSEERIGCGDNYTIHAPLNSSTMLGELDNGYPYTDSSETEPTPGVTPAPEATPTPDPENVGNGTIIFSEDFESYDVGSYPGDWGYYVSYQTDLSYNPSVYLNAIKVTDTDQASGSKSLLLVNTSSQEPVQITKVLDTSKFTDTVYLRLYIKQSIDLGRSPGNNHATLLGLRGETGQGEKEVRFGDAKGVLGININPTDGIAPVYEEQASQLSAAELAAAPLLAKDVWHCLELGFLDGGEESQMFAWNNNELIFSVEDRDDFAPGGPSNAHWLTEQFHEVMIGWQSWIHSGDAVNENIWVDDIVASTDRIGCN